MGLWRSSALKTPWRSHRATRDHGQPGTPFLIVIAKLTKEHFSRQGCSLDGDGSAALIFEPFL